MLKWFFDLIMPRCQDCGGKMERIGEHHGMSVYECTVCHKKWISVG